VFQDRGRGMGARGQHQVAPRPHHSDAALMRDLDPVKRRPCTIRRRTRAPVSTVRLARPRASRRNALAVDCRRPRWIEARQYAAPSWSPPLSSSVFGMPACSAAPIQASSTGQRRPGSVLIHGPVVPCPRIGGPWTRKSRPDPRD
jgi:hypothetical protein